MQIPSLFLRWCSPMVVPMRSWSGFAQFCCRFDHCFRDVGCSFHPTARFFWPPPVLLQSRVVGGGKWSDFQMHMNLISPPPASFGVAERLEKWSQFWISGWWESPRKLEHPQFNRTSRDYFWGSFNGEERKRWQEDFCPVWYHREKNHGKPKIGSIFSLIFSMIARTSGTETAFPAWI